MKTLLILAAFFMAICYFTSAHAMPAAEWEACAKRVTQPIIQRCSQDPTGCTKELCDFYGKPLEECTETLKNSDQEQVRQIIGGYLLHGVIIPACGTPDEAQ